MGEEAYPYGDALIPEQFDERTVIFLVRPPDAPEFSEEELDRLQIEHLTHLRSLKRRGVLLANGPLDDQTDVSYRGIGIYGVPLDEALALANDRPDGQGRPAGGQRRPLVHGRRRGDHSSRSDLSASSRSCQ